MGEIYGCSVLNIAVSRVHQRFSYITNLTNINHATSAADGNGGLFNQRIPSPLCTIVPSSDDSAVYDCTPLNKYATVFKYGEMPLLTRAWTVQERILPLRTVHFTSTEVFWECCAIIASESSPDQYIPTSHEVACRHIFNKNKLNRTMWDTIVEGYSTTSLTYLQDRPIAIAGIAKIIHDQTGAQYFAGIWEDAIIDNLMWCVDSRGAQPRPKPYRAPSWSWLSIEGEVSNYREKEESGVAFALKPWVYLPESLIEIIDVNTEPPNCFGTVKTGVLRLRGLGMLKLTCDREDYTSLETGKVSHIPRFSSPSGRRFDAYLEPDCSDWPTQGQEPSKAVYLSLPTLCGRTS